METKIERLDGDKVKFDITIEAAEVDEAIDAVYADVKKSARIPGFRKGKAPRQVLESNFGAEYFTSKATIDLIEKHSPELVDSNDYIPLGDYDYDADEIVEAGKDYTYSFTIQVKPIVELTSVEPVEIKMPSPVATDAEIDEQVDLLRSYYIDLKTITDRPVQDDDIVVYSQECSVDGEDIEEGKEDRRTYVVGGASSTPEFDQQIIGMSIGETKDFVMAGSDLGLGDKYPKPVTARITVEEITEKAVPELTDEWAQNNCDVESVEALRKQVGDSITSEKERSFDRNKSIACLDELVSRVTVDMPSYVVIDCTTTVMRNFYNSLQQQGYTLDQYLMATGQDAESFYNDLEKQGEELAKQNMALDALARAHDLACTDEDIDAAFEEAEIEDPEALRQEWIDEHRLSALREEITRDKAAKWLYENAVVEYVESMPEDEADEATEEDAEDVEVDEAAEADAVETEAEETAEEPAEAETAEEEPAEAEASEETAE